jgi:small-conductance mechanosensitive channel
MELDSWLDSAKIRLTELADPWILYQAAIVVGCAVSAVLASRWLTPKVEERLRRITGQPKLLRLLVVITRRMTLILLAIILWVVAGVMREATWPGHSSLVLVAAELAAAWAAVSVLSRAIRNRSLARVVEISLWAVAALAIVGWLDDAGDLLDWIGITLGERRLSLLTVLQGLAVFGVILWATSLGASALEARLRSSDLLRPSAQVLSVKFFKAVMVVAAAGIALAAVGFDPTILTVFSGAFGLGLALSLQKVTSNLMSGVIILMDRSIKPGDVIELGGTFGWINSLRARYVSVATRDGAEYLIPNETFVTERVVNWSHSDRRVRQEIKFGVTYDCDPHEVRRMVVAAVAEVERVMKDPPPVCHLVEFGDSSLNFTLRFWIDDPEQGLANVKGMAMLAVWDTLKRHGVAIPYPHREVILRKGK